MVYRSLASVSNLGAITRALSLVYTRAFKFISMDLVRFLLLISTVLHIHSKGTVYLRGLPTSINFV